jgi:hypothetical protein
MANRFWYKKIVQACPNCNYTFTKRVRVNGEKPKLKEDRVEVIPVYDFLCGVDKRKGK